MKRYYDDNGFFSINSDYQKIYLPEAHVGEDLAEYKKLLILVDNSTNANYIEIYQILNDPNDYNWYEKNENGEYKVYNQFSSSIAKNQDCSAINYYVKNYCFNNWLNIKGIHINEINKREAIIDNINKNLNLSMSNYSANSSIDYKLPELTDEDWEQALSNISMMTFFQGVKVGLKTYNNYSIVTSTQNNEYISDDSLYYLGDDDIYYHTRGCKDINNYLTNAYLNTEFKINSYSYENSAHSETSGYFYKHLNGDNNKLECFNCIVNRNNMNSTEDIKSKYLQTYYRAIARERYIQSERTKLIDE